MNEFETIAEFFAPLTMGQKGSANLTDDAAVISIPNGYELVVTSDTLNEGTHFLEGEAPENIARKALRVNLSDLASMGAKPVCYQLNLAFPEKPSGEWLKAFASALLEDNKKYKIFCSGGDTTGIKGDVISISITAMGIVPKGKAVRRGGAKDGDLLVVTGNVGDAVLGLKAIRENKEAEYQGAVFRYRIPEPRCCLLGGIQQYASACADISDGVIADSFHIAKASGLGLEFDPEKIILSDDVQCALDGGFITWQEIMTGGDDYELSLAVSPDVFLDFSKVCRELGVQVKEVGRFYNQSGALKICNNKEYGLSSSLTGWTHW